MRGEAAVGPEPNVIHLAPSGGGGTFRDAFLGES